MKNNFNYKWSKLFAAKRYDTVDGVINLTPEEQQELLNDSEKLTDDQKKLYSEIEHLIIVWNNSGNKTAGSLTREIMDLLIKK